MGQDTIVCKTGEKIIANVVSVKKGRVIYKIPPSNKQISVWRSDVKSINNLSIDTSVSSSKNPSKTKFIFSINTGIGLPGGDYGNSQDYETGSYANGTAYGFSGTGYHIDFNGLYMVFPKVGLLATFGFDENSYNWELNPPVNKVSQYLAGVKLLTDPYQSTNYISFIFQAGLVSAYIKTSNVYGNPHGYYTEIISPGLGYGVGAYAGVELTGKIAWKLYFNSSMGYLISGIYFSKAMEKFITINANPANGNYTTSYSTITLKMDLQLLQFNVGLSIHI